VFLTDAELYALTGRRRAKMQAAWLRSRRIRHYVNAAGKVVVRTAWLDGAPEGYVEVTLVAPDFTQLEV
jgi:hypothetical protein